METVEPRGFSEHCRRLDLLSFNLGSEILSALADPEVVEISLNDDGQVWVERNGEPMCPLTRLTPEKGRQIVSLVADALGQLVTTEQPVVEGEFPLDGSRFEGLIPPVVQVPVFSLRKHCSKILPLREYVDSGIMPEQVHDTILRAIEDRKNILVVGGTGSGKTTLVNGIIHAMSEQCPQDRLVLLEDTRELQAASLNVLFLRSTVYAPMQILVKCILRLRPDRIIVGEVRGGEALDLLMAWNTGHPGGVSTVHANSAPAGLIRMEQLVGIASVTPMPKLIGEAVDLILFINCGREGRRVEQAMACHGYDAATQKYDLETIYEAAV